MSSYSNIWWAKGSILLKKYYNYFDPKVKEFGTSELIKADIDGKYNDALKRLERDDKFYNIKLSSIDTERKSSLDYLESLHKKTKRMKKKADNKWLYRT